MRTEEEKLKLWEQLMEISNDDMEFTIERATIQENKTFSEEAMEEMAESMHMFIGSRMLRTWQERNKPPTNMVVYVRVEII